MMNPTGSIDAALVTPAMAISKTGMCSLDLTTGILDCSADYARILGVPGETLRRDTLADTVARRSHPQDRAGVRECLARAMAGEPGGLYPARIVLPDGNTRVLAFEHGIWPMPDGSKRLIGVVQDVTDRTSNDRSLADQHRQLEHLMNALPGVVFQLRRSADGQFTLPFLSPGTYELIGHPASELSRSPARLLETIAGGDIPALLRSLAFSAESLAPWEWEAEVLRPDGLTCWVRMNAVPVRDVQSSSITWHGFGTDITAAKEAEQALRESERRLQFTQFAVDHVRDSVVFINADGDRLYVNDEGCRMSGYTREELLQSKIWSTFSSFTRERYDEMWRYLKTCGTQTFEAALVTKQGLVRPVDVSVTFIGFGGQEIVFAIARDISARKAAETALRQSEERLRLTQFALDHARDIVSISDRQGDQLYVNNTFCRFTGFSREELGSVKLWEAFHSLNQQRFEALWDDVKRCGTLTFELELRTRSGEEKPLEVIATYLDFGGREAICTISRDLTPRRAAEQEKARMQQQLQETQKLESLGVLAGGIAHDFNNLLTGVLGNASLARDRLPSESDLHGPLRQIERAATRAAELCQQMLAYAGKGRFVVEPVNLSLLVEDTAKLLDLSVARRAKLELQLDPTVPPVLADATQLRQIVMNLVLNAAEAINQPNGLITVSTGPMQVDAPFLAEARVTAELPEGPGVYLEVKDTGAGMTRETLERIFEPFFTTKFTGRGLGLAAVVGIVRSHHGALCVRSEPGHGTTFRLVLAAHDEAAPPASHTPPIFPVKAHNQGRVLVVDDEESVRSVSRQALERMGFTVDLAEDGEAALALLRREPHAYSFILLDYTMPGIDGAQTLREIRGITPDARVVLMSGFPEQQARERLGEHVLSGFIQKPFDLTTLRRKVEELVQGQPPAR
ncbi:hypothetical protein DB347_16980 [Opitutaceae bacterium EW11]|nr:hypothetical protein DB347_16980 [Opitutaceae bacterium EW11]